MSKPLFVLISDIHFNINTLPLASASLRQAVAYAQDLNVPLVIGGDLNDTKALLRAEVVSELIDIFELTSIPITIIPGNHDLLNHHAEVHSLKFLEKYAKVYTRPHYGRFNGQAVGFIPYQTSKEAFLSAIQEFPDTTLPMIVHQGVLGAFMGDYVQDKSSIDPTLLGSRPIFSGHYHKHQTVGPVTYIGSPYTVTFGEANDGPKGFLVVNDDWTYQQIPTNLRKHVIETKDINDVFTTIPNLAQNDLLWLKVTGRRSELEKLDKIAIGNHHLGHANYKLEKICVDDYTDSDKIIQNCISEGDILDTIIDRLNETEERKIRLKQAWRTLV